MNARLTFLTTAALAGILVSCQQPFVDQEARDTPQGATSSLTNVSFGPGDASFLSAPSTFITKDGDGDNMANLLLSLLTSSSYQFGSGDVQAISGLPGYVSADSPFSPAVETQAGTLQFSGDPAGAYAFSLKDYEEMSPQYFAELSSPSGGAKLFKRAEHRVSISNETWNISWSSGSQSFKGTCVFQFHSEWYKDVATGPNAYQLRYGLTEYSVDFVVAATDATNAGAKIVGKVFLRQSIFDTNGIDLNYPMSANVSTFDGNGNQFFILTTLGNNSFPIDDATDIQTSYYSGLGS